MPAEEGEDERMKRMYSERRAEKKETRAVARGVRGLRGSRTHLFLQPRGDRARAEHRRPVLPRVGHAELLKSERRRLRGHDVGVVHALLLHRHRAVSGVGHLHTRWREPELAAQVRQHDAERECISVQKGGGGMSDKILRGDGDGADLSAATSDRSDASCSTCAVIAFRSSSAGKRFAIFSRKRPENAAVTRLSCTA